MLSLKANKSTFFLGRNKSDQEENRIKQKRPYKIKEIFIKSYYDPSLGVVSLKPSKETTAVLSKKADPFLLFSMAIKNITISTGVLSTF